MIHHVSLGTNDPAAAARFYDAVLPCVGMRLIKHDDDQRHYGGATLHFSILRPVDGEPASPGNGVHIAFAVEGRGMVDDFHRLGLQHGGSDAGAPGPRPEYDAHYYGAFLIDPDGNKVEAVTFAGR